jgi:hypothetical protein
MKWTVQLVAETAPEVVTEHDLLTLERPDRLALARLGLSIEEAKQLLAALQNRLVPAQVERHGQFCPNCPRWGRPFRGRGSYLSHLSFPVRRGARAGTPPEDVPVSRRPTPELLGRSSRASTRSPRS